MDDALAWKKNVRKVLKKIIATTLQEAQGYLNEDATNETLEILSFHQDKLKRKINAVKTLARIEAILTERAKFEIESKEKQLDKEIYRNQYKTERKKRTNKFRTTYRYD